MFVSWKIFAKGNLSLRSVSAARAVHRGRPHSLHFGTGARTSQGHTQHDPENHPITREDPSDSSASLLLANLSVAVAGKPPTSPSSTHMYVLSELAAKYPIVKTLLSDGSETIDNFLENNCAVEFHEDYKETATTDLAGYIVGSVLARPRVMAGQANREELLTSYHIQRKKMEASLYSLCSYLLEHGLLRPAPVTVATLCGGENSKDDSDGSGARGNCGVEKKGIMGDARIFLDTSVLSALIQRPHTIGFRTLGEVPLFHPARCSITTAVIGEYGAGLRPRIPYILLHPVRDYELIHKAFQGVASDLNLEYHVPLYPEDTMVRMTKTRELRALFDDTMNEDLQARKKKLDGHIKFCQLSSKLIKETFAEDIRHAMEAYSRGGQLLTLDKKFAFRWGPLLAEIGVNVVSCEEVGSRGSHGRGLWGRFLNL